MFDVLLGSVLNFITWLHSTLHVEPLRLQRSNFPPPHRKMWHIMFTMIDCASSYHNMGSPRGARVPAISENLYFGFFAGASNLQPTSWSPYGSTLLLIIDMDESSTHPTEAVKAELCHLEESTTLSDNGQPVLSSLDRDAEKRLLRKLDLRIIPILWLMFMLAFLDRTNVCIPYQSLVS
jgi:hypothetical protein